MDQPLRLDSLDMAMLDEKRSASVDENVAGAGFKQVRQARAMCRGE